MKKTILEQKLMEKTYNNKVKQLHDVLVDINSAFEPMQGVSNIVTLCDEHTIWAKTMQKIMQERWGKDVPLTVLNVSTKSLPAVSGVKQVCGQLTDALTAKNVLRALGGELEKADYVLCDGLPDYEHLYIIEVYLQIQLFFVTNILKFKGNFITRVLVNHDQNSGHYEFLSKFFEEVKLHIPPERLHYFRYEAYFICRNYKKVKNFVPQTINPLKYERYLIAEFTKSEVNHSIIMECLPREFPLVAADWGHQFEPVKEEKKTKAKPANKNMGPKNKRKHK